MNSIKVARSTDTRVVTSHLPAKEERRRMTLEALADVKAGRTHAHAGIEAWAGRLGTPTRKTRR